MTPATKPWPPIGKLRLFTIEQGQFIKDAYLVHAEREIAGLLNDKAGTSFTTTQIASFICNRGFRSGRNGEYAKGHRPWNSGTKGTGICKANAGSFVRGNIPHTVRPIGSKRIDAKDGYLYIKVSETAPMWRMRHVTLWEEHHGPIPPGHNVQFIDSDRTNITIENLELISKAVNFRRNIMGYSAIEPEVKPLITTIAKVDQAVYQRRKEENGE